MFPEFLACPRDLGSLALERDRLTCPAGHSYPVIDGVPVFLLHEVEPTHPGAAANTFEAIARGAGAAEGGPAQPCAERAVDPFVQHNVVGTCGNLYGPLTHRLARYPIPTLRLPPGEGHLLLDVGCSWGRWSIAAARAGYQVVGIDPSYDGVAAARRIARSLGLPITYVVGDARRLPLASGTFDFVFSYSVLQHFSKPNVRQALGEVTRTLKPGGISMIQMPNALGVRSLYHQVRRGFRQGESFDVRYWTLPELRRVFTSCIGASEIAVDGFFGLGVQRADVDLLPPAYKAVVYSSELLRWLSERVPGLCYVADSLYVRSRKPAP